MTRVEALAAIVGTRFDHPVQCRSGYRQIYGRTPRTIRYPLAARVRSLQHWAEMYDSRKQKAS